MDRASWADVIRQRREVLDLTQQQLAAAAGVSLKTISNIENEALTPQRNTLRKVREALGLSSDLTVAAAQAAELVKIENEINFPFSPKELDGFLAHLADRISRLEDRVDQLDGEHLSGPLEMVDHALAANEEEQTIEAEQESTHES